MKCFSGDFFKNISNIQNVVYLDLFDLKYTYIISRPHCYNYSTINSASTKSWQSCVALNCMVSVQYFW